MYPLRSIILVLCFVSNCLYTVAQTSQSYQPPFLADSTRKQKLEKLFPAIERIYASYAASNHFPGYAFGVVLDGQLVFSGAGGYTDVAKKIPVTTQSMFRIASMSKSFTAMAILHLRDAGKLHLDDPVATYIPEMKAQQLTNDAAPITIRDLMTHSAGFPEDNPWGDRQLADTDQELLALIKKGIHFSNTNGLTYEYSNLGFAMLGYIIKKVSGKPYSEYIRTNIWQPLGMKAAEWEYSRVPEQQLAKGYRWINGQWQEEALLHDGIYGAMGGMISSIESFSKYVALHLQAWPPRNDADKNAISRSSIREMHQPWRFIGLNAGYKYPDGGASALASAYGYGLRWTKDADKRITVGHSGGLPGFGSNWAILPEYGLGVMLFANVTYAPSSLINTKVLDTLVRAAVLTPRQLPPSQILVTQQKALLQLLPNWQGAVQSGLFADNFFADYPLETLQKEAKAIFEKAGRILQVGDMVPENQLRGSFLLTGEKMDIEISFTLTPEHQPLIQEYHIRTKPKTTNIQQP